MSQLRGESLWVSLGPSFGLNPNVRFPVHGLPGKLTEGVFMAIAVVFKY